MRCKSVSGRRLRIGCAYHGQVWLWHAVTDLASHDSPDWLYNGSLFHSACGDSWQQRCIQKVIPRRHQSDVILLTASRESMLSNNASKD